MNTLATFPLEIISVLACYLSSTSVISLWKCGSGGLTQRLRISVTQVRLEDDVWHSTSRWPKLLSELPNLEYLRVKRKKAPLIGDPYALHLELKRLSPKIRCLKLEGDDLCSALLNYVEVPTADQCDQDDGIASIAYARGSSSWMDLSLLFPRLERLSIFPHQSRDNYQVLSGRSLAALPDSLTQFATHSIGVRFPDEMSLAMLPRNLITLKANLSASKIRMTLPICFPPNLTRIDGSIPTMYCLALPAAMETLSEPSSCFTAWTANQAQSIPPNLLTSYFSAGGPESFPAQVDWLALLPKRLTQLSFTGTHRWTAHEISCLPRSLNHLKLRFLDLSSFNIGTGMDQDRHQNSTWPPSLTHLTALERNSSGYEKFLATLPPTLLELVLHPNIAMPSFGTFPPNLTYLRALRLDIVMTAYGGYKSLFPESLTHLDVCIQCQGPSTPKPEDLYHILPSSLVRLSLAGSGSFKSLFPWDTVISNLPQLLDLDLDGMDFDFTKLPRSLKSLSFILSAENQVQAASNDDFFSKLPPHLERLVILPHAGQAKISFAPNISFGALTHLKELISEVGSFSPSVLKSVPRDLRKLRIELTDFQEEDLPFLPQHAVDIQLTPVELIVPFLDSPYLPLCSSGIRWKESRMHQEAVERCQLFPDPRVTIALPPDSLASHSHFSST